MVPRIVQLDISVKTSKFQIVYKFCLPFFLQREHNSEWKKRYTLG